MASGDDETAALPPPPPVLKGIVPTKAAAPMEMKRLPMARRGLGTRGTKLQLLTNHFNVKISNSVLENHFYQYSVAITYEDGKPVEAKGVGRKVLDKVQLIYKHELADKNWAYDGEKSLFTIGALPQNILEFDVVLGDDSFTRISTAGSSSSSGGGDEGDSKRSRRQGRSSTYKVAISYATKIPLSAIAAPLRGKGSDHFQEAVRVLDTILRQHAAKKGCLLVRQSFFQNVPANFVSLDGGVNACRGLNSSFRSTQGGLSLNMDVSTTIIVKPGPVIRFLLDNQSVTSLHQINWVKAKRTLKNLRITAGHSNQEHKIVGLSDQICRNQTFELKRRTGDPVDQPAEITVYDYYVNYRNTPLPYSGDFPCINVGRPKRPTYFPIEHCNLVSLQRYTKSLTNLQRTKLVESSRQAPDQRMKTLSDALRDCNYNADQLFTSSGISISYQFTPVEGRVLQPPKLRVGNGEDLFPRNGKWDIRRMKFIEPKAIERWFIVNFSRWKVAQLSSLSRDIIRCGRNIGMSLSDDPLIFEENSQFKRSPAPVRVEKMIQEMKSIFQNDPQLLLCILPERKNCDIYGPWKKKSLSGDVGVVTQCIAPPPRVNDQYINNVLLKINAKMGGINSRLTIEHMLSIPNVSNVPTLIVGMDVSHGSPGRSDVPSIAAVVSSRNWPSISCYRAAVRTQSPKVELIDSLCKKVADGKDEGTFREMLIDFYQTSRAKPQQIIIFRDGVSESQFNQVLNTELDQIMEACKLLEEAWTPKFMFIVAQKNHHTKFFSANNPSKNVPPGTVVDNGVCHPRNNDFYMCAHAGNIGTTRPTHYHVLYDELGFTADDVQELVHNLSYVYQKSTTAISIVAPIRYAHLAAAQVSQFVKFDDMSETSSGHGGVTSIRGDYVPELPKLHKNVCNSMFFC